MNLKAILKLFKSLPIEGEKGKGLIEELRTSINHMTIKRGFIFSPEIFSYYTFNELENLIFKIEKEYGISPEELNASFHKSWKKVRDAPMAQLIIEQIMHYLTTYGFEALGVYSPDSVYIPHEQLDIPEITEDIKLVIIKGYTHAELEEKLMQLLSSGIALKEETVQDAASVFTYLDLDAAHVNQVKNKEIRMLLYDYLRIVPENNIEFLQFAIYQSTDTTLLIKNNDLIQKINEGCNKPRITRLFWDYVGTYGVDKLGEIFFRFKPLWLAFKGNSNVAPIINRMRKLADKHHKPMQQDYLNTITARLKREGGIDLHRFIDELQKVNVFRKCRLAYALNYRLNDVGSILYKIRNGKSYATEFSYDVDKALIWELRDIVIDDIAANVPIKGKTIYIPEHINYALPISEKQFSGAIPHGTIITCESDMIFGTHWFNKANKSVDLDLSMVSISGKIGWDGAYRSEGRKILFSGDITDAPKPHGASELFYVKHTHERRYLLYCNYYNREGDNDNCEYKLFVGSDSSAIIDRNYMIDPNKALFHLKSKMEFKQRVLGMIVVEPNQISFCVMESAIGKSMISRENDQSKAIREYLYNYYFNTIQLKDILERAGAVIVTDKQAEYDIDLSPENLEKDTIINILS